MCGIAGLLDWSGTLGGERIGRAVEAMCERMIHRGPDDAGVWVNPAGSCALGHRRLSIIDLSEHGRQPMAGLGSRTWVTFNGEIYNHRALREHCAERGTAFATATDTEVLPHVLAGARPDRLADLDGMFAFAVWDESARRLLLARDPFGKKPLYYWEGPGCFAFASELAALREVPGFEPAVDRDALALYMLLQYVPAPWTVYRGARKLPPGHFLELSFDGDGPPSIRTARYAEFRPGGTGERIDPERNYRDLKEALVAAVDKRLMSDVPLGAFLSGGVDSSLVAAIAVRELGIRLKTFTVGFEGSDDSEHLAARDIAEKLGTEHFESVVKPDGIKLADQIAARLDEPNGDSSCLPTFLLCAHAREHVTVALSGDGGDEMFGGYGRYRDTLNEQGNWLRRMSRRLGLRDGWSPSGAYLSPRWLIFQPEEIGAMFGGVPPVVEALLEGWRGRLDDPSTALIHRMRGLDADAYLPGAVLAKVDRMSMQVSLEVRCPFLDRNVAAVAERLSPEECWSPPDVTKRLLKRLASEYLPSEWMHRRKLGFGLPANAWSKDEILLLARDRILGPEGVLREYVDPRTLAGIFERQAQPGGFSIYQVWPLLILESWLRCHLH